MPKQCASNSITDIAMARAPTDDLLSLSRQIPHKKNQGAWTTKQGWQTRIFIHLDSSARCWQVRVKAQTSCSFSLSPLSLRWSTGLQLLLYGSPSFPHLFKALQVLQLPWPSFSLKAACAMAGAQWEREAGSDSFVPQRVSGDVGGWSSHPHVGTEGRQVGQALVSGSAGIRFYLFQVLSSVGCKNQIRCLICACEPLIEMAFIQKSL